MLVVEEIRVGEVAWERSGAFSNGLDGFECKTSLSHPAFAPPIKQSLSRSLHIPCFLPELLLLFVWRSEKVLNFQLDLLHQ